MTIDGIAYRSESATVLYMSKPLKSLNANYRDNTCRLNHKAVPVA